MEFNEWVGQLYDKPTQGEYDLAAAAWNAAKLESAANPTRTIPQNNSLHLYCEQLAEELNNGGWTMKVVFDRRPKMCIDWSKDTVKEKIWRPIQEALLMKQSTTRLVKKDVSAVYETVNRFTTEEFGLHVPFPDRYSQSLGDR